MPHPIVENVVKQGYLKKGNYGASRLSGLFRRNEANKWFVFTIRQCVPFLEYYDSDVDVFTHQPINSFNLSSCQNVKPMGGTNPPSFCIVCPERIIELIASSRTQMVEWVNEVEASLTRLGILKNEVVDHVYTVCPAVVRKSRINREIADEKEVESSLSALPTAASSSEPRHSGESSAQAMSDSMIIMRTPTPPPRSPPSRQRTISMKPSSHAHLASRTSSFHGSSQPTSLGLAPPPPLPLRLPSYTARTTGQKDTEETAASGFKESSSYHPVTEGSNDSDFVSPEVIAELRQRCLASKKLLISQISEADVEANTSPPVFKDINTATNKSYFECNTLLDSNLSPNRQSQLQPALEPLKVSRDSGDFSDSSLSSNNDAALALPTSPLRSNMPTDSLNRPEEIAENDYCAFPCQQRSDSGISCTEENNSGGSLVSKSTTVARKTLLKMNSCPGDMVYESQCVVDAHKDTANEHLTSDDPFITMVDNDYDKNVESDCTTSRQVLENEYMIETNRDDGKCATSDSHQVSVKQSEPSLSKDENENIYGLVYDNGPPTTAAPPPPIPPLPPRQNSFQAKQESTKSITTQEVKTVWMSSPDTKNPTSSPPLPPSAFAAAASGKHRSLPNDPLAVPPLPLPRKSGSNPDSLRKPHQASAFTSNGPVEIPPMPPRRASPYFSLSQEDQPPALPSRNLQSFFIKRPQITGLSSNMRSSSEDASSLKRTESEDHLVIGDGKPNETGAATSASQLSKKMLLDQAHSLHTVVSLKLTQAEILQTEISMASVHVIITQNAGHGIALVDWNNFPCIVGWNQKDFPSLHGKLHLGDLIFSINNVKVTNSETAQKLLKQASSSKIEIMLHRMPYAKVFAIHRNVAGQSLGLKRDGGTGEIVYVDPNGLAAQHGLTNYAQSAFQNGRCNWFLTEINNRPLNLFFKDNEIDHRLLAVGREISLVVQPSDFIYEIRHQFKKLKNYKNFITQ